MRRMIMLNYLAGGTVLGSVFLLGDLWVILVSRDVEPGAGSAKYVVSLYTNGHAEWHEGTYFDFYPEALDGFVKKIAGQLPIPKLDA